MDAFLGTIQAFGFNYAPLGWQLAQGQIIPLSSNTALFTLLGTNFGGNGTSNFALPDLQGRVTIGQGAGVGLPPYKMGEAGGTTEATLLSSNLPPHRHQLYATSGETSSSNPAGLMLTAADGSDEDGKPVMVTIYGPMNDPVLMSSQAIDPGPGSSVPFGILQPFLAINYAICINGVFPSRN
jgi:microcystin-dependent protein